MNGSGTTSSSRLWAITSFYNPLHYKRRQFNYAVFRERLPLPLLAVELSFNGEFELCAADAEIVLQYASGDVMWQKERLLNLALAGLPRECEQVLWVDCDVIFQRPDIVEAISRGLDQFPLVQPFSAVHQMPRDVSADALNPQSAAFSRRSATSLIDQGMSAADCMANRMGGLPRSRAPGHAWAARRDLLHKHGLYDACIIGGGDTALASAAYGVPHEVVRFQRMNDNQANHYLAWAESFHHSVRGGISCVAGDLLHLWHGESRDRRASQRYSELAQFCFDPQEDIALDRRGCWRWNTDKSAMHACLVDYFAARKEDGRLLQAEERSDNNRSGEVPAAMRVNVAA